MEKIEFIFKCVLSGFLSFLGGWAFFCLKDVEGAIGCLLAILSVGSIPLVFSANITINSTKIKSPQNNSKIEGMSNHNDNRNAFAPQLNGLNVQGDLNIGVPSQDSKIKEVDTNEN